jgi:hypothetical protein
MYRLQLAPIAPNLVPLLSTPILQIQAGLYDNDAGLCFLGDGAEPFGAEPSFNLGNGAVVVRFSFAAPETWSPQAGLWFEAAPSSEHRG